MAKTKTGTVLHATDATFDDLVADAPAVLVDLWAPWCPPCVALGPIVRKVAAGFGRKVTFVKVNVDENPDLARRFRVSSIPKLVLIQGKKRSSQVGLMEEGDLRSWIREQLAAGKRQ
jgi:thioredoxin 1